MPSVHTEALISNSRTTLVLRNPDGTTRRAAETEFAIGRIVRAWSTGSTLDSCPGQTTAAAIELLP